MMQVSEQEKLVEILIWDLILLAERVEEAVEQAKWFKVNCRKVGKRVVQLSQVLDTLLYFTALNPKLFTYLNPIHLLIQQVSMVLQEALTLACTCKRRTIFCRLFSGTRVAARFHRLYHLLDNSVANMKWLVILYNPDFGRAFDDIFLSLPQILGYDSSMISAWSCLVSESMVWKLVPMLSIESSPLELKICCAEALSMLNVGSALINHTMIEEETELREALMSCLAKLVGEENGDHELQNTCLTIIVEITAAAESNLLFRLKAFNTNSPGAMAIIERLLWVIKNSKDPTLQVLAIKSIGSLARMFREKDDIIGILVPLVDHEHQKVVLEALVALQKFVSPCNYLCKPHSKRMIEFKATQPLLKLLSDSERVTEQLQALVLMCNLAINAGYSKAMEEAKVRTTIDHFLTTKRGGQTTVSQHPELKDLVVKASKSLALYYAN